MARAVDFERDIRPILAGRCQSCHGAEVRKGGLRLDRREEALAGGDSGAAFEPGQSVESELVLRVAGVDETTVMPPKGEQLSAEAVGLLRAWIDQGAKWPEPVGETASAGPSHWAFRAPVRPALPEVSRPEWVRNAIDRFVMARLDREGLSPSPEADRRTLIRRLSLDLIGLPPRPEEVEAYCSDPAPDAYERLVDRLLASPHYGERWARRWLDAARYADTNGYEKDRERSMWPYRDWVIRALNADLTFDRFTVEQLAGDLLPQPSLDQRVATGFHRNTMINEEGGIDVEEFRYISLIDRVSTTGTVWLGLTIACAQCHTHKYDPITQREFYEFLAFFNNADEPEMEVPDPVLAACRAELESRIATLEADLPSRFPLPPDGNAEGTEDMRRARALEAALGAWEASQKPVAWTVVRPERAVSRKHATMTLQGDGSILVTGDKPNNDTYEVDLPVPAGPITAFRLEVLPDPSLPDGGPGRAPLFSVGDFILTNVEAGIVSADDPQAPPVALKLQNASQDYSEPKRPAALAIDDVPESGWTVKGGVGRPHAAVFEFAEGTEVPPGGRLRLVLHQFGIHQMTIGRFRMSVTTAPRPVAASGLPAEVEDVLLTPRDERSEAAQELVRRHFLSVTPELAKAREEIEGLRKAIPRYPTTMVFEERAPQHARTTHVHPRGEFLRTAAEVRPDVPSVLPELETNGLKDRLALARWLVSPANPLTARVAANRAWQALFGRGLVATAEDFGTRGEPPTHPELLDWLATELVREAWSLKALHRTIVTSATYRQESIAPSSLRERDPDNRLLARGARFRIDAEAIRDLALSTSGLLAPRLGGPSVYPPQPEGVTALAYGQMAWPTSAGPDRYRRGLYTFTKRTAPYAGFTTFDQPTSETVCVRRERSNTPMQALTLLNDAVFVEAAQALARRIEAEAGGDLERGIERAYELVLSRVPSDEERAAVRRFYLGVRDGVLGGRLDGAKLAGSGTDGGSTAERAAWAALARALLNLDETITRE